MSYTKQTDLQKRIILLRKLVKIQKKSKDENFILMLEKAMNYSGSDEEPNS